MQERTAQDHTSLILTTPTKDWKSIMSKKNEETEATDLAAAVDTLSRNLPPELTERQKRIFGFRLRNFTQTAIAKVEGVSQPMIAKEVRKIKEVLKEHGRTIDQELVVGEALTVHQEVERRAWEIFFKQKDDKPSAALKALDTVMTARDKTHKLLMDVGAIKKAAVEHEHTMKVAPFVERFQEMKDSEKQDALRDVIEVHMGELEEPEPPQLVADLEIDEEDA